jgi:HTH-type transcriptional regulator/antitoxin HigA
MEPLNIREIAAHYRALDAKVPLRPIRNRKDYGRAVDAMNALLDAGAADEAHPLAGLAATLGELIGEYEARHLPTPDLPGREMLRFLMDQHGLTQSDLPEIGSQGVVSEILSGKRELNVRQVRALAERFGIGADAFLRR